MVDVEKGGRLTIDIRLAGNGWTSCGKSPCKDKAVWGQTKGISGQYRQTSETLIPGQLHFTAGPVKQYYVVDWFWKYRKMRCLIVDDEPLRQWLKICQPGLISEIAGSAAVRQKLKCCITGHWPYLSGYSHARLSGLDFISSLLIRRSLFW
jgi:hypothetical protein